MSKLKVFKMTKLWAGLSAAMAGLLSIAVVGSGVCYTHEDNVNELLNASTGHWEQKVTDSEVVEDTDYYKTTLGDHKFTEENLKKLKDLTQTQAINEMREGAALLKNNNNVLPLNKASDKITLVGVAAGRSVYQSSSGAGTKVNLPKLTRGGGSPTPDENFYTLTEALTNEGFTVDESIINAINGEIKIGTGTNEQTGYAEELAKLQGTNGTAVVVLGRFGGESNDMKMDEQDTDGKTISSLALHKNEKDMLAAVKNSGKFSKIVVLLNIGNTMEVAEVEEYADAIMYIGTPGHWGFQGVAEILSGKVNPSGHVVDTFAVSSLSAPAVVNSGTRTPEYSNKSAIEAAIGEKENATRISFQAENIYIGYNYYETRYYDSVANPTWGASSAVGASNGATSWKYENEVSYPFGYGLSYTTFKQTIKNVEDKGDEIVMEVEVQNTGSAAGKSVVQVYAQTPYGTYEQQNEIEASAATLVGYGKTKTLATGTGADSKETVKVTVDKYLLAQYDAKGAKGYIMSGGDYYLAIGDSVHDAVNNILAKQNFKVANGMDKDGDASKVWTKNYSQDTNKYKYSTTGNGKKVTNQFQDCDLKTYYPNIKYLSRHDWAGTYPTQQTTVDATEAMIKILSGKFYKTPEGAPSYAEIAAKFNNGSTLTLAEMMDVPLTDRKVWEEFVYQVSMEEAFTVLGESFGIKAIGSGEHVISGAVGMGDGCDAIFNGDTKITIGDTTYNAIRYCGNAILTGTFNDELNAGRGTALGEEGLWCTVTTGRAWPMSSNTGNNLHRTPFGGRNPEYKSECPNMNYLASIPQTIAMEATGAGAAPKHFAGNDQETAREGVSCFFTEQAFRQGSLRAFEGSLKIAKASGLMQSFERLGMTFASSSYALNITVLRDEWNSDAFVITDACPGTPGADSYKTHNLEMIEAGSQSVCFGNAGNIYKYVQPWAETNNDGHIIEKVVDGLIYYEYQLAKSCYMNGQSANRRWVVDTPWWQTAFTAGISVLGVLTGICAAALITGVVLNFLKVGDDKE